MPTYTVLSSTSQKTEVFGTYRGYDDPAAALQAARRDMAAIRSNIAIIGAVLGQPEPPAEEPYLWINLPADGADKSALNTASSPREYDERLQESADHHLADHTDPPWG